jgi:hypothetical protein
MGTRLTRFFPGGSGFAFDERGRKGYKENTLKPS